MGTEATEAKEAAEATEAEAITEDDDLGIDGDEFDADRALRTIRAQREAEKSLKAELAELRKVKAEVEAKEAEEAEAQKTLSEKLADREKVIESLKAQIAAGEVRRDFEAKARAEGIEDLSLAYLAAKEAGLLGDYSPKAGIVGDHDFEKLAEKFPSLFPEDRGTIAGDAGVRVRAKKDGVNQQFNRVVREAIRR